MTLRHGKSLACKVILLDDQVPEFNISVSMISVICYFVYDLGLPSLIAWSTKLSHC